MIRRFWALLVVLAVGALPVRAGEGVVALQTAEPSCPSDDGRYVSCGNGTVTDNQTGLVWLAKADCLGSLPWLEAMAAVAGLADLPEDGAACDALTPDECDCGLSDGSSAGEWRLPTIGEWEEMVEHASEVLGCTDPAITNDAGDQCWDGLCVARGFCSFRGVQSGWYWSSSSSVANPQGAWLVVLDDGSVASFLKESTLYSWPVRGGQ